MIETISKITTFFEDPFWICIYERESNGLFEAVKITFGAEPKDYEVYEYLLNEWGHLSFSHAICVDTIEKKPINPKRLQRVINKQLKGTGVGTKAQQALKLQQEQNKLERKTHSREQRELDKEHQFEMRQQKRKEKHRGH